MEENSQGMRVLDHPILRELSERPTVHITYNGQQLEAIEGEMILAALAAQGIRLCRTTNHRDEPRWFYCGIGRCTDCVMVVDGVPNVRTCVTPVVDGMEVETQHGKGTWSQHNDQA